MLGAKIFHYVEKSDMSVPVFAGKLNISEAAAYKIFKKESIQTDLLLRITAVLKIPVTALLEEYTTETNLPTLHEPESTYHKHPPNDGENEALRELVRTQRELIEQLKTAGSTATNEKNPDKTSEPKSPVATIV